MAKNPLLEIEELWSWVVMYNDGFLYVCHDEAEAVDVAANCPDGYTCQVASVPAWWAQYMDKAWEAELTLHRAYLRAPHIGNLGTAALSVSADRQSEFFCNGWYHVFYGQEGV